MTDTDASSRPRRGWPWAVAGALKDILVALLLWLLWQAPLSAFLWMPPRLAVLWLAAVAAFFLWCHAAPRGWSTPRGRATVRVRPVPQGAWPWLAALAPLMAAGALSMWMFLVSLGLAHDRPLPRVFLEYGRRPGGGVPILLLIVGMAPLIEEFAFRGWMQRPLERRIGPAGAIGVTAAVFALAHLEPGGIPIRVAGGLALGYAVWATGSIWASLLLHVAWNTGVLLFGGISSGYDPTARGARVAVPAAAAFVVCAGVFVWLAPRLREGSRRPGSVAEGKVG